MIIDAERGRVRPTQNSVKRKRTHRAGGRKGGEGVEKRGKREITIKRK